MHPPAAVRPWPLRQQRRTGGPSDIGRGSMLYGQPDVEASVVAGYLPVPLAGACGAAQLSTVNGAGGVYELSSVVGVVRSLAAQAPAGSSGALHGVVDGGGQQ